MEINNSTIITRCNELRNFWSPRDSKMRKWYRLIQMIDELKTDKLESFVGNDPRSMYNLVLHMLNVKMPHRLEDFNINDFEVAAASSELSKFYDTAWKDMAKSFRKSGPRQDLMGTIIGYMLSTGWYSVFSIISDDGSKAFIDVWNPIEVYPMWDGDLGLNEVAHIYELPTTSAKRMCARNGWKEIQSNAPKTVINDYWWIEIANQFPFTTQVWNAVCMGNELVYSGPTRFKTMPIYIAPVGGLPDMGPLCHGSALSTSSAGSSLSDRWKGEIGQSIVATNENVYRAWNKWWTFSLQLLRDTAQPRVFERSKSGKPIVKPEELFKRGGIFRGTVDDSVDFLIPPPIPLELRSSQLDMEAMMQRGGVSWALYGNVTGQMTSYVMSQISASANQVLRPFQSALINLVEDIDNAWLEDIKNRGIRPYGWKLPPKLPDNAVVSAKFEVEIPGDLVQRLTAARMADPEFRLSYSYVSSKLFPEIKDPMMERAAVRADMAEMHPTHALIALITSYRKQAAYLNKQGDYEAAKLYEAAAQATFAEFQAQQMPQPEQIPTRGIGTRTEGMPRFSTPEVEMRE